MGVKQKAIEMYDKEIQSASMWVTFWLEETRKGEEEEAKKSWRMYRTHSDKAQTLGEVLGFDYMTTYNKIGASRGK